MRRLTLPVNTKHLALLAVLVLAVTAGCLGAGDTGDDQPENISDDTATEEIPRVGNLDPVEENVSGDEVLSTSVDELENVDQYSFKLVSTQNEGTENERQGTQEVTIDAVNQEAFVSVSQTYQNQTNENREYLVDGYAYRRSDKFDVDIDSEWIKRDVSDRTEALLARYDMAGELTAIFGNATATVEGEATYQGERVYVLTVDIDEDAMEEYYGQTGNNSIDFTNIEATTWVSAESNLPLRVEQVSDSTTPDGAENTVADTITLDYSAGTVSLPEEAVDAPSFEELRNQSGN